jgi:hypothetical protein
VTLIRGGLSDPDDHGVEMLTIERDVAVHDNSSCRRGWKLPEPLACEVECVIDLEAEGYQLGDVVAACRVPRYEGGLEGLARMTDREVNSILQANARQLDKFTLYWKVLTWLKWWQIRTRPALGAGSQHALMPRVAHRPRRHASVTAA